jgi:hypothetical protein
MNESDIIEQLQCLTNNGDYALFFFPDTLDYDHNNNFFALCVVE